MTWSRNKPTKAQRRVLSGSVTTVPKHYRLVDGTAVVVVIKPLVGAYVMPNERTRDVSAGYHEPAGAADAHEFPLYAPTDPIEAV